MKLKKTLIIAVVVLAVAIAAVLGFTMKPAEKAEHDYFIVNQGDKALVMDALNPGEVVAEFEAVNTSNLYCSEDNSALILSENIVVSDECEVYNLVHFDIDSKIKTVVSENVTSFVASSDLKTFLYSKENDTKLYKKSLTDAEPEIITEKADEFYMSDDGKTIIYKAEGIEAFLRIGENEAISLGKDVTIRHFEKATGDFVYYDDSKLAVYKDGKETVVTENIYTSRFFIPPPKSITFTSWICDFCDCLTIVISLSYRCCAGIV